MTDWYYAVDGVQYGPVAVADLKRFLAEKTLAPDDTVWNPEMPAWTKAAAVPELMGLVPLFAVGLPKLVLMMFGTFGAYQFYWFYKHWTTIRKRTGEDMMPVARAIFALFFINALASDMNDEARLQNVDRHLSGPGLTILFFILNFAGRLPDPGWLLYFLVIPMLMAMQSMANEINAKAAPLADPNTRIRRWNWIAVILGLPFFLFTVWSLLDPTFLE